MESLITDAEDLGQADMKLSCEACGQETDVPEGSTPPRACGHCGRTFPPKGTQTTAGQLQPLGRNQKPVDPTTAPAESPAPAPKPPKKILKKLKPNPSAPKPGAAPPAQPPAAAPQPSAASPAPAPQPSAVPPAQPPAPAPQPSAASRAQAEPPPAAPELRPLGNAKAPPPPAAPAPQAEEPANLRPLGKGSMTSGRGENSKLDADLEQKPVVAPEVAAEHKGMKVAKAENALGVDQPKGPEPENALGVDQPKGPEPDSVAAPKPDPRPMSDKLKTKGSKFQTVAPLGEGAADGLQIDAESADVDAKIDPKPSETGSRLKVNRSGGFVSGDVPSDVKKGAKVVYLTADQGVVGVLHPVEQAMRQSFRSERLPHDFVTPDETGQQVGELRDDDIHVHLHVADRDAASRTASIEARYEDGRDRHKIIQFSGKRLPDSTPEQLVVQLDVKTLKSKVGYPLCKLAGERTLLNRQAFQFVTFSFVLGLLGLIPYVGYLVCLPGLLLGLTGLGLILGRGLKGKKIMGFLAILLNLTGPFVSLVFTTYLPMIKELIEKAQQG